VTIYILRIDSFSCDFDFFSTSELQIYILQ